MRYYVDGYNLLFRAYGHEDELQVRRERVLDDLRDKVEILKLQVTLVFDSQYQLEEETRSNYGQLAIIFTTAGETADDCILSLLKSDSAPQKKVVVSSDKRLTWQARRYGARTETVEEFLAWLNKRYYNKIRRTKIEHKKETPAKLETPKKRVKPGPKATLGELFEYYLEIFQARLKKEDS